MIVEQAKSKTGKANTWCKTEIKKHRQTDRHRQRQRKTELKFIDRCLTKNKRTKRANFKLEC